MTTRNLALDALEARVLDALREHGREAARAERASIVAILESEPLESVRYMAARYFADRLKGTSP